MPLLSSPQTTVIIVGSGLAGFSAASQLVAKNVPVRLLERGAKPGGNSIKASSGINGAPTAYQPTLDDAFFSDTVKSAGISMLSSTKHREHLISTLTKSSKDAVEWLVQEKGVDLSKVSIMGGHTFARTHRGSGQTPPGFAIMSALLNLLKASPLFHLQTSCTVTKVLRSEHRVTGVEYTSEDGSIQELRGPVIFASGGFGGDAEGLLAQYRPDLKGYPSTNDPRPGTQPILTAIGAQLIDMEHVQVHPTGFVDPAAGSSPLKFLAAEVLRGDGGILLSGGQRFVNELEIRENVTNVITATSSEQAFPKQWNVQLVLDEGVYEATKSHVDFYIFKGLMKKATISDLASGALESISQYSRAVRGNDADTFGRTEFAHWHLDEPAPESVIYVGTVTPVVHFTMGGVLINELAELLNEDNERIEGLWAAGEVAGGVHGANRLGGSSLLECVVFGRIAGDQCVKYIETHKH
jgi:FAD-dependent fumarate reductase